MIGFSMAHARRPPRRLGLIWIQLSSPARDNLSSVIWVVDLLARFHELDVGLGQHPAIGLLQILEHLFVVMAQHFLVLNRDKGPLVIRSARSVLGRGWCVLRALLGPVWGTRPLNRRPRGCRCYSSVSFESLMLSTWEDGNGLRCKR